jgi:hypothetical protein
MSAPAVLFVAGGATAVAFDIHLENRRMMDEPVTQLHRLQGGAGTTPCASSASSLTSRRGLACAVRCRR